MIPAWDSLRCRDEVCLIVCAPLFQADYLPFTSPPSSPILPSIQTAATGISRVQSLNFISEETLYLLQLYRVWATSRRWSFLYSTKGDALNLRILYLWEQRRSGCRDPSSPLRAHCCGGLCQETCRLRAASASSHRVQGEYRRFWIDILGAFVIHRADWDIYHTGSKGQRGFSSVRSAYTDALPSLWDKALEIFFSTGCLCHTLCYIKPQSLLHFFFLTQIASCKPQTNQKHIF